MVAKSTSCNFNMRSLLSLFSVETMTTTLTFQERKMLWELQKKTFCGPNSTNSREEKSKEEVRRGAETTTRRIWKENPATTAHANLAYVITFPSKCITQSLCIGLTLKRQKQHTFLRKLLLENSISLCTVYYKYLYFIPLPVDSENNLNISTLLCT